MSVASAAQFKVLLSCKTFYHDFYTQIKSFYSGKTNIIKYYKLIIYVISIRITEIVVFQLILL